MSSETPTSTYSFNKTEYGNILLLTYLNYEAWKDTMFHVLRALDADNIITGEEEEPMPIDLYYKDYKSVPLKLLASSPSLAPLKFDHTSRAYKLPGKCGKLYKRDSIRL